MSARTIEELARSMRAGTQDASGLPEIARRFAAS